MYLNELAGTPTQVVYVSVWKDKIIQTNTDLIMILLNRNLTLIEITINRITDL